MSKIQYQNNFTTVSDHSGQKSSLFHCYIPQWAKSALTCRYRHPFPVPCRMCYSLQKTTSRRFLTVAWHSSCECFDDHSMRTQVHNAHKYVWPSICGNVSVVVVIVFTHAGTTYTVIHPLNTIGHLMTVHHPALEVLIT